MTQDEIIEMARQAGIIAIHTDGDGNWHQQFVALEAFAKLVAAKEREKFCVLLRQFHDSISLASDPSTIKARGEA
jgi:hypothetical protein